MVYGSLWNTKKLSWNERNSWNLMGWGKLMGLRRAQNQASSMRTGDRHLLWDKTWWKNSLFWLLLGLWWIQPFLSQIPWCVRVAPVIPALRLQISIHWSGLTERRGCGDTARWAFRTNTFQQQWKHMKTYEHHMKTHAMLRGQGVSDLSDLVNGHITFTTSTWLQRVAHFSRPETWQPESCNACGIWERPQPGQPPTTIQSLWSFGHGSGSFSLQLGIQFWKSFRRCYLSKKHQKAKCHSKQEQKLPLLHAMPPCHAMPVHLLNAQASASSTSFQCVVASFFPVHRCLLLHQTAAKLKSGIINFGACQVVINWEASESAAKLFDSAFSLPD